MRCDAGRMATLAPSAVHTVPGGRLSARRRGALAAIETVLAVNAAGGMAYALGGARNVPSAWLDGTPFDTYVFPGVYLGVVVGGSCALAAYAAARDHHLARPAALTSAAVVETWIGAQVALIGYRSPLQPIVAATGLAVAARAGRR
jgi:hypothetical protein